MVNYLYRLIMQFFLRINLRSPVDDGYYRELLLAYRIGDVVIGDRVEIEHQTYLFQGMNKHGGPGQSLNASLGFPTPYFASSKGGIQIWDLSIFPYWRKIGHWTPEEWKYACEQSAVVSC